MQNIIQGEFRILCKSHLSESIKEKKDGKKALLVYEDPRSLLSEVCFIFPCVFPMLESHTYTHIPISPAKRITPQHTDLRSLSGYIGNVVDIL